VSIALLRWGSLAVNVATLVGVPVLLGAPVPIALLIAVAAFAGSYRVAGRVPGGEPADAITNSVARRVAERMQLAPPRFVRRQPGWTAGAVRVRGGYGLVVGEEVEAKHREAVLAHELAHVASGDLRWEPWADGFARILTPGVRKLPPLALIVFPFFLLGAPLARITELRADDLAASCVSSYPAVIQEVAAIADVGETLLYPSLRARATRSARRSLRTQE
jgi:hypothetical protein